jgi:hypothetical protein
MKDAIHALTAELTKRGEPVPAPASAEDLERARAAGFPDDLIDLYRQFAPKRCIELKQRIWSIAEALVENMDAVPGCALSPHGFIVFASTVCGDAYCVDTNITTPVGHHPIVLFSHEVIEEDMPLSDILRFRVEVATSLKDFLEQFTNETLREEPSYG